MRTRTRIALRRAKSPCAPIAMWSLCPMIGVGNPGGHTPLALKPPGPATSSKASYQMHGALTARCGSLASIAPPPAELSPASCSGLSAHQFEPCPSQGSSSAEGRTASYRRSRSAAGIEPVPAAGAGVTPVVPAAVPEAEWFSSELQVVPAAGTDATTAVGLEPPVAVGSASGGMVGGPLNVPAVVVQA